MPKKKSRRSGTRPIVNEFNLWRCLSCVPVVTASGQADLVNMEHKAAVEHLKSVHGLSPPIKGSKKMLMHLDSADSFQSTYEWDCGGVKMTQYIKCKRDKDDMMRGC